MMSQANGKTVLVLGAGLVTRPLVEYLLGVPEFQVTVADIDLDKAAKMVGDHPRGKAVILDVEDDDNLRDLVGVTDLVVSLLPYIYHVKVAKLSIELGRPMVTASYVSPEMKALDQQARDAGVVILNEIGMDPGIDHMSAMKIIHDVREDGGKIVSFTSNCGGLPAPEANDNPCGYKFSWSPRGVVLAARSSARYLWDGEIREIPGEELFTDVRTCEVSDLGTFEVYPNRNSLDYKKTYGLEHTQTLFRGTFRNVGHCACWRSLVNCGWTDLTEKEIESQTYGAYLADMIGSTGDLKTDLAARIGMDVDSEVINRMEWLGLLGDEIIPAQKTTNLDVLVVRLLAMLSYRENERDMLILQHNFIAEYPDGRREEITSTLTNFGIPGGDHSMARTVSLPVAIATRMILQGEIDVTGVHIPVIPEIYNPVLAELATMDIGFEDTRRDL
jgi:saccharopine dehydrogenase (NADP+, L-glutamate forming)